MRREYVECDICGKEIMIQSGRLKAKICEGTYGLGHPRAGEFKWRELDICPLCSRIIQNYVKRCENE